MARLSAAWRDFLMMGGGISIAIACWLLGQGIDFLVSLHYIDGAERNPVTPGDQTAFAFAHALPYIGAVIGLSLIVACAWWGTRDKWRERRAKNMASGQ